MTVIDFIGLACGGWSDTPNSNQGNIRPPVQDTTAKAKVILVFVVILVTIGYLVLAR